MAKQRTKERRDVHLDYVFDRLLAAKLQQVYEILVPEHVRLVGERVLGEGDADRRDLRQGVLGQAEGGQHHCQSDGGADRVCPRPKLQRAQGADLRRRRL